jgi:nucleosome binding factor SPN SPT16 subunit
MSAISINRESFYRRTKRLVEFWKNDSEMWGNCETICIMLGTRQEDANYSKASALHLYLLGYEIADSIIVLSKANFWFMASEKKCQYLERDLSGGSTEIGFHTLHKSKDEGMNREHYNTLLGAVRKSGKLKLGSLYQVENTGTFIESWIDCLNQSQIEKVDIPLAFSLFLSVKDEQELVFSNTFIKFESLKASL